MSKHVKDLNYVERKRLFCTLLSACLTTATANAGQPVPAPCRVQHTVFQGWQAEEVSNSWLQLIFVPQLGGRLMQVRFSGHPYLFVNPRYAGQYISPQAAAGDWINYGGDKVWPLPEGDEDEQHWGGASSPLDDGPYEFSTLSAGDVCKVRLVGPNDPPTGLQYTREISISRDSPEISFHAVMRNFSGHTIDWSMQTVSQYDLADAKDPKKFNTRFVAYAPLNQKSSYLLGYHVRDGLANDPSYSTHAGLFRLNWKYLESEVWLDSTAGWIALVDSATSFAMVERSRYIQDGEYPSKASVIFYKNGPTVHMNADGFPTLSAPDLATTPYYMEAELNSPMISLLPGQTYSLDTTWQPSRMEGELTSVVEAGLISHPLKGRSVGETIELSGVFGVFVSGQLKAMLYGPQGKALGEQLLQTVTPETLSNFHATLRSPQKIGRVSLHVIDSRGVDRGSLGEVTIDEASQ